MEMVPCQDQGDQGGQRDDGEHGVVAGEQAPGRAGIGTVRQVETSGNDRYLIAFINGVGAPAIS